MMSATLRAQRLGALEATTLLRKVMEEIDVAVFAFDGEQNFRLVNRAGERLLGEPSERLLAPKRRLTGSGDLSRRRTAADHPAQFPGGSGRWGISRSMFREGGLPHQLLVVTDLTRPLREEELKAWQRLVRVLGHELNNSLAPIKSIAGSLEKHPDPPTARLPTGKTTCAAGSPSSRPAANPSAASWALTLAWPSLPQPTLAPVDVGASGSSGRWARNASPLDIHLGPISPSAPTPINWNSAHQPGPQRGRCVPGNRRSGARRLAPQNAA